MKVKDKCGTSVTARSIWYTYRRKSKKVKQKFIDYGDYRKFILDYHKAIVNECVVNRFEYKAPCRLGTFKIAKKKHCFVINPNTNKINQKYVMIDWKETKLLWSKKPELKGKNYIYYTNKHTGGFYFKWEWSRTIAAFQNMNFYLFTPVKNAYKFLSKVIMEDPNYDALLATKSQKRLYIENEIIKNEYYEQLKRSNPQNSN